MSQPDVKSAAGALLAALEQINTLVQNERAGLFGHYRLHPSQRYWALRDAHASLEACAESLAGLTRVRTAEVLDA